MPFLPVDEQTPIAPPKTSGGRFEPVEDLGQSDQNPFDFSRFQEPTQFQPIKLDVPEMGPQTVRMPLSPFATQDEKVQRAGDIALGNAPLPGETPQKEQAYAKVNRNGLTYTEPILNISKFDPQVEEFLARLEASTPEERKAIGERFTDKDQREGIGDVIFLRYGNDLGTGLPTSKRVEITPSKSFKVDPNLAERFSTHFKSALSNTLFGLTYRKGGSNLPAGISPGASLMQLLGAPASDEETRDLRAQYEAMRDAQTPEEALTSVGGELAGSAPSPENYIPITRGASLAGAFARGAGEIGALNLGLDALIQGSDVATGLQDKFDIGRLALSGGAGALLGGTLNALPFVRGRRLPNVEPLISPEAATAGIRDIGPATVRTPLDDFLARANAQRNIAATDLAEAQAQAAKNTSSIPLDITGQRAIGAEPTGIRLPDLLTAEEAAAQGLPYQRGAVVRNAQDEAAIAAGKAAEDATIRQNTEETMQDLANELSQLTGRPFRGIVTNRRGKTDLEYLTYLREQINKASAKPTTTQPNAQRPNQEGGAISPIERQPTVAPSEVEVPSGNPREAPAPQPAQEIVPGAAQTVEDFGNTPIPQHLKEAAIKESGAIPDGVTDMPPIKAQVIRATLKEPDVEWVYSHYNLGPGYPEFSQVDAIKGNYNLTSTNPSDLRAFGFEAPDLPPNTPQGKYTLEQAKALAAEPVRSSQIANEPVSADVPPSAPQTNITGSNVRATGTEMPVQRVGQEAEAGGAPPPKDIAAPAPKELSVSEWKDLAEKGTPIEDLPTPKVRSKKDLKTFDEVNAKFGPKTGAVRLTPATLTAGGAVTGGAGGAAYGLTQGDTPEERVKNAIKYGSAGLIAGAGIGGAVGRVAIMRGLSPAQRTAMASEELSRLTTGGGPDVLVPRRGGSKGALTQISEKALGTEGMPTWYLKFRSTPIMQAIRTGIRFKGSRAKDVLVDAVVRGEQVPQSENFYAAQRIFPRKLKHAIGQVDNFFKESETAFRDAAKQAGFDPETALNDYANYMRAKHAADYNRYVSDFDPKALTKNLREKGYTEVAIADEVAKAKAKVDANPPSGMTDAEAAQIIATYKENGLANLFEDFAKTDRPIIEATRDILEKGLEPGAGIITKKHADWLRKNAPDYVPMNRDLGEDQLFMGGVGGERGYSVKASGIRRAQGSQLGFTDMRGNIKANLIDAITRAYKNQVSVRAARFLEAHPTPGITVRKPRIIGSQRLGGRDMPVVEPLPFAANEARFDGKPTYMIFSDPKLANAFGDFNPDQIGVMERYIGRLTRLFSGLVTRFRPNFWVPNLLRDRQDAFVQHLSMNDWKGAFAQLSPVTRGGLNENMRAILDHMGNVDSPGAKLYSQFLADGSTSGGYSAISREDIVNRLTKLRQGLDNKAFLEKDWLKFVDVINDLSENSTRLGAYRRALQLGATREQAAMAAGEISLDFDMKGTLTREAGALYAFFNPATQGPVNFTKAIIRNPKKAAAWLAGIAGISAALNEINKAQDPDWKLKPGLANANKNGFPVIYNVDRATGRIDYFTIPIAQSMRPYKALIDFGIETATSDNDKRDIRQEMKDVAAVIFSENPVGASRGTPLSILSPTLTRPLVDIAENQDYAGRSIYPQFFEGMPEVQQKARMYASTQNSLMGKAAIQMSAFADAALDLDVSPEHVKYIIDSYFGGPGQTLQQMVNASGAALGKGEITRRDIPVVSSFFRSVNEQSAERNTKEYKDAYKAFSEAATNDAIIRGQAMNLLNKVRDLPKEQWPEAIKAEWEKGNVGKNPDGSVNHEFSRVLSSVVESALKNDTPTDSVIRSMGVANQGRARYYLDKLNSLATPEEKVAYIRDQRAKGLMTPEVEQQVGALMQQNQAAGK